MISFNCYLTHTIKSGNCGWQNVTAGRLQISTSELCVVAVGANSRAKVAHERTFVLTEVCSVRAVRVRFH